MTARAVVVTEGDLAELRRVLEVAVAVFDPDDGAHGFALGLLDVLDREQEQ